MTYQLMQVAEGHIATLFEWNFISEECSKNGYISEATKAMTEWVFNNLKLDYLIAIVEPDNIPSQRVVES